MGASTIHIGHARIRHEDELVRDKLGRPRSILQSLSVRVGAPAPDGWRFSDEWKDSRRQRWARYIRRQPVPATLLKRSR